MKKLRAVLNTLLGLFLRPTALAASLKDFHVLSDRETLLYLKENNVGIVRFGDGEFGHLVGYSSKYQTHGRRLGRGLAKILQGYSQKDNFLIALPMDLILGNNYKERQTSARHWRLVRYIAMPFLKKGSTYGSPFCFRLDNVVDNNKEEYRKILLSLFKDKDIIYVGSVPLTSALKAAHVINIPSTNVFYQYDELLNQIRESANRFKTPLVLIAAGVTAKLLSADLNKEGILTYDIGTSFLNRDWGLSVS